MYKIFNICILILISSALWLPAAHAQQQEIEQQQEQYYKAEVLEVLEENEITENNATTVIQQNLRVKILDGDRKNEIIAVNGIADTTILNQRPYDAGDTVVLMITTLGERETYTITDAVRTTPLIVIALLFVLAVIMVGRKRSIRALVVLAATMLLIIYFVVPQIIAGTSPLLVSILAGIVILALAIYGTEGISPAAHISFASLIASLLLLAVLSIIFTYSARLTGLASEEVMFIIGIQNLTINLQGLLLAGIIIGSLGVLDDTVVSQVSVVRELAATDHSLERYTLFTKALRVGIDHITAIINTLFLAYAGVSLPLLVIFSLNQPPFLDAFTIFNNEIIATEIIRTLVGSIALVLSVPLATYIAAIYYAKHPPSESTGLIHHH